MVSLSKCTNTFNASVFWCYYGSSYDMPSEPIVIFFVWYLNLWLSNEDDYLLKWRQTSCICIFNSNCFLPASLHNYIFAWRSILWFYRESLRTNFCGFNIIIAQNQKNVDIRKPFIIQNTLFFFFKLCTIIIACVKYFT